MEESDIFEAGFDGSEGSSAFSLPFFLLNLFFFFPGSSVARPASPEPSCICSSVSDSDSAAVGGGGLPGGWDSAILTMESAVESRNKRQISRMIFRMIDCNFQQPTRPSPRSLAVSPIHAPTPPLRSETHLPWRGTRLQFITRLNCSSSFLCWSDLFIDVTTPSQLRGTMSSRPIRESKESSCLKTSHLLSASTRGVRLSRSVVGVCRQRALDVTKMD